MFEKNTMPKENQKAEDRMIDDDPCIARMCRLMGVDDSTENPGWIRCHLLLMCAFVRGFVVGFHEAWPGTKMQVKEAWSEFKEDMKEIRAKTKQ